LSAAERTLQFTLQWSKDKTDDGKNWQTLFLSGAGSMMLIRSAASGVAGQEQQKTLGKKKPPLKDIIG
jgi:hypothetical protein